MPTKKATFRSTQASGSRRDFERGKAHVLQLLETFGIPEGVDDRQTAPSRHHLRVASSICCGER